MCLVAALGLSGIGLRRDKRRLLSLIALTVSSAFTIVFLAVPSYVEFILSALGC